MSSPSSIRRREFLLGTAVAGGALAQSTPAVSLVLNSSDAAVLWAAEQLTQAFAVVGTGVTRRERVEDAPLAEMCLQVCGIRAAFVAPALKAANVIAPDEPESLVILNTRIGTRPVLMACGGDARGLVYALLELADRVRHPGAPGGPLAFTRPIVDRPANEVRSVMRQFVSEPHHATHFIRG